ncbi:MAG TPA: sulfatase-like hydrolase/transferase [Roseiarcus sp.]|nr:sulfatase-like hydrolase/transferase [Roseiarcus sp.]
MHLRHCLALLTALVTTAVAGAPSTAAAQPANKPNIVFIMADDLGFADVGYRGSPIKTPNIDKLPTEGVRMDTYGAAVCTPSRAELMTGHYPMRYGLVIFPSHTYGLATDERTLPQALKDAGYATLMDGKWHLGHADKKYWPQNRGFDYFYGNVVGEIDYFTHARGGVIDWQRRQVPQGVPIRLTQTATICSGANDKLQGSWSEGIVAFESRVVQK